MSTTTTRTWSLALVAVAYVIAIVAAAAWLIWGPATGRLWLDTLIADVLATLVVFAFSRRYRNSSFYDAFWSVIPIESVADVQLHRFIADRQSGDVMDRGLWRWSRHPNYFGEFGFWFALALFGVAASPADAWWLFAGALAMLAMFLGASIPMMEKRSLERRPEYQRVIDGVSRFVPLPPHKVVT
ncbi:MAG: DUF1295 domain-containing protein [Mycobacterium sp.]|uniref:DUF1295 domain-containing protein n=1 Tax=Mycobacterium sp. TaxID=1785 RepID=UPI001EC77887|nr:DUF1295 domain-containing protein [Mycobacterium sp.]MBV8785409.1 DUF1295 domain-containing protein [Mycobacterium sp.]